MTTSHDTKPGRRTGTLMAGAGAVLFLWPLAVLLFADTEASNTPAVLVAVLGAALLVGGLVVRALRG